MKRLAAFFLSCTLPLSGQSSSGEFHLKVVDPSGAAVKTTVEIAVIETQCTGTPPNPAVKPDGRSHDSRL
jgi:hypothetical protein